MVDLTSLLVLLLLNSQVPPASAQDESDVSVRQTTVERRGEGGTTTVDQIGSGRRTLGGSPPPTPAPFVSPQVTGERGSAYSRLDLKTGPASAEAPASPASRSDSRNTSTTTLTGTDRCDPQQGPLPVRCDEIIEARASEFRTPDTDPLSAEQRLLATQREPRTTSTDFGTATRRLASGEIDNSEAALAVASVALQDRQMPARDEEIVEEPSALDAIVAGITTLVGGQQPNP